MNRRLLCFLISLISLSGTSAQSVTELTAEKSFTEDIEGPQIDQKGYLYVVNLGKNGRHETFKRTLKARGRAQARSLKATEAADISLPAFPAYTAYQQPDRHRFSSERGR